MFPAEEGEEYILKFLASRRFGKSAEAALARTKQASVHRVTITRR
jgi:hypothetical protein